MANRLSVIFLSLVGVFFGKLAMAVSISGHVANDDGGVPDVVVTAMPHGAFKPARPLIRTDALRLDQKGKEFIPHILALQTGTPVFFPNSDDIQHHVYSFSSSKRFEIKLYKGTPTEPIVFDQPGIVALGCNIHDWMLAYVYVTDTPYFTQTNSTGDWRLELPAGEYRLSLWHPDVAESDSLPNQIINLPATDAFQHNLQLKPARQTGKPPTSLQLQDYPAAF